jgi:hypothetical protein
MKTTNKALPPCDAGWSVANRISDDYADGPGADAHRKLHQPNSPICSNSWATKMLAFSGNCRFLFFV